MGNIIVRLYDYIKAHKGVATVVTTIVSVLLLYKIFSINYKEDISDFLPLDDRQQNALSVYQEISGANKLFIAFKCKDEEDSDPDKIVDAIGAFADELEEQDTLDIITDYTARIDYDQISEISDFVYKNIPYFLDEEDYQRIEKLLEEDKYIGEQLAEDKRALLFPMGGMREVSIGYDPLSLFSPVFKDMQERITNVDYEIYEDCIFTSDLKRGIVMVTSPYGNSETDKNPEFVEFLKKVAQSVEAENEEIEITIIGGPVIAIGNSQQIKIDSIISVIISVVLILLLLLIAFGNVRNIGLIVISISWGMLFAVGALAFVHDEVSIIVIGIASVIIGIAVNYPLHLVTHLRHTEDMRSALKEIVMPLLIGNVTTVGAFLALVPLQSIALSDLGLFSSFLLIGTIIFSLIILPHLCEASSHRKSSSKVASGSLEHSGCSQFFEKLGNVSLENKTWLVWGVVALTVVFSYYSIQTSFDSNLSNINYITEEQKVELEQFERMLTSAATEETLYLITSNEDLDEALDINLKNQKFIKELLERGDISSHTSCSRFITSKREQERRIGMWREFVDAHSEEVLRQLDVQGKTLGFTRDAFADFEEILKGEYEPREVEYFGLLTKTIFSDCICADGKTGSYSVLDIITTPQEKIHECREKIQEGVGTAYCFDVKTLNSSIAESLSDNFNYIGFMCGCIVFFFLWFSFGRLELAILSFIPMAISWVWILGIMAIFGMQFNIVNVILATFIFGQGDDYTIFMTEGASYEYTYRKKMLASYKQSIILSALIMFIGIGSLIVAKHPALHSLAEVTIVGMFSVVLMAYMFPPLVFKFLVSRKGQYRIRPLSIRNIFEKNRDEIPERGDIEDYLPLVRDRYRYKGMDIERKVRENLKAYGDHEQLATRGEKKVVVINGGYGEIAMLLALKNRGVKVVSLDKDEEKTLVSKYSNEFLENVETEVLDCDLLVLEGDTRYYIIEPTDEEIDYFNKKCEFSCIGDENVVILRR